MRLQRHTPRLDGIKGNGLRFAVMVSDFNVPITDGLLSYCLKTLKLAGVAHSDVAVLRVPGAFELPLTGLTLAKTKKYDAVIALGCIIRGETPHDRYISQETARGLGQAALQTGVPMIFGVLTTLNAAQARARSGSGPLNKGRESALAALRMANLMRTLKSKAKRRK